MATGKNGNGARLNGRASRSTTVRSDSRSRRKVRVAILGVGNCASSLVQGVEYYRDAKPGASIPGLMHVDLGGYHIRDIEFSAAFDIDKDKVGKDLSDVIFAGHNNTVKFADVPHLGVKVERGYIVITYDVQGQGTSETLPHQGGPTDDIPWCDPSSTPAEDEQTGCPGVPFQQEANFVYGTIDAIDFFMSTPDKPYKNPAGSDQPLNAFNPLWQLFDRSPDTLVARLERQAEANPKRYAA